MSTARPPLIAVIGATGTGKSNLAVDLALALNGEVINADAMQLYAGLPIITNKLPAAEMRGVPHHLLGVLAPREVWRIGDFLSAATRTIADIHSRSRLPILVGGTHYYVQSLLFPHSLPPPSSSSSSSSSSSTDLAARYPILSSPTPVLYAHLRALDPTIAAKWHPHDRRKILRSLEIYYASHCTTTASSLYSSQRAAQKQPPPYRNLIFWVHAEPDALKARLDTRVDAMVAAGLWEEVQHMKDAYDTAPESEKGCGVWQSIGFKEFLPYLALRDAVRPEGKSRVEWERELDGLGAAAVENMKAATRQYARSQIKWIRIKLLNALRAATDTDTDTTIYLLDSTSAAQFASHVTAPAVSIASSFLSPSSSSPLPDPAGLSELAADNLAPKRDYDMADRPDLWVQRYCESCGVTCTNEREWGVHVRGKRHKGVVRRAEGSGRERYLKMKTEEERLRGPRGELVGVLEARVAMGEDGDGVGLEDVDAEVQVGVGDGQETQIVFKSGVDGELMSGVDKEL